MILFVHNESLYICVYIVHMEGGVCTYSSHLYHTSHVVYNSPNAMTDIYCTCVMHIETQTVHLKTPMKGEIYSTRYIATL